eukprot:gene16502-18142_t
MEYKIEEQDGKPNLKLTDSDVVVFNRPKHFVGSNGSVWASEFMRLRCYQQLSWHFSDIDLDILQNLISSVEELTKLLQGTSANSEIWIVIKGVLQSCSQFINNIAAFLPKLKSRILEFTDGGPGVGVSNHDVKLRCAEIILLTNADYYIRHHLASGDSSQNEVERCQSYVGDAICDGGPLIGNTGCHLKD